MIDWLRFYGGTGSINLEGQNITEMDWTGCPSDITNVSLNDNKITEMNWSGCPPGLTIIDLSFNKITEMNWDMCPVRLIYIELGGNNITEMNWKGCPSDLYEIFLYDNQITHINWDGCPSDLVEINLDNNKIREMNWVGCPPDLNKIELEDNEIEEIDFNGCRNNMIISITPDSFYDSYLKYQTSRKFIPYPMTKFQSFIHDIIEGKIKDIKKYGIDPSLKNNRAIFLAYQLGHFSIVKTLLKDHRVDPSSRDGKLITLSFNDNNTEIIKLLLKDPRVDPRVYNNYPLQAAIRDNNTEIIKLLLKDPRVDPSVDNNYSLRVAIRDNNNTEIIKLLLKDPRVDPSVNNNYPLRQATEIDNTEITKLLLNDTRVDPTAGDNKALYNASENGNHEIVKILASDQRVINSLSLSRKLQTNRLFPNSFSISLKGIIKEKLFPLVYKYDSQSQKVCDIFNPLNQIELDYVADIYSIDKSLSRIQICNKLGAILQSYITNKNEKISSCNNTETSIGGDNVKDIPARKFFTYTQDDKVYCEDLEEFHGYIQSGGNKNPFTGVKLADDIVAYVKSEYNKFSKDLFKKYSEDVTNIGYSAHLANLLTKLNYPRDDSWYKSLSGVEVINFIKSVPGIKTVLGDNGVRTIEEIRTTGIQELVKFIEDDSIQPDKETKKILISHMWNGDI